MLSLILFSSSFLVVAVSNASIGVSLQQQTVRSSFALPNTSNKESLLLPSGVSFLILYAVKGCETLALNLKIMCMQVNQMLRLLTDFCSCSI